MSTDDSTITIEQAITRIEAESLSVEEAAAALGLREQTVRSYVASGRLTATRLPSKVRIAHDQIERHLEHQRTWRANRRRNSRTEEDADE